MYIVVGTVDLPAEKFEEARKELREQIIPRISGSPGFIKGFWTIGSDPTRGMSFLQFQSEQDAQNVAKMMREGAVPRNVSLVSVEVREVIAEA